MSESLLPGIRQLFRLFGGSTRTPPGRLDGYAFARAMKKLGYGEDMAAVDVLFARLRANSSTRTITPQQFQRAIVQLWAAEREGDGGKGWLWY